MNILYLIGALLLLFILGYAYFLLVTANKEKGATRIVGQALSGLLVLVLLLLILFYQTGIAQAPWSPTTRMTRGMLGYLSGVMREEEEAIDEFIDVLKADPKLYEKFKEKLR